MKVIEQKNAVTDKSESVPDDGLIASLSKSRVTQFLLRDSREKKVKSSEQVEPSEDGGSLWWDSEPWRPTGSDMLSICHGPAAASPQSKPRDIFQSSPFSSPQFYTPFGIDLQLFMHMTGFHTPHLDYGWKSAHNKTMTKWLQGHVPILFHRVPSPF